MDQKPKFCLCLFLWGLCSSAQSKTSHYGYTQDVQKERDQNFQEVSFVVPQLRSEKSLQEMIFNPLKIEFRTKYRETFGENDTRSIVYRPPAEGGIQNNQVDLLKEETSKRKEFAEYMVKRLVDHHVDNYMKTKPEMRPVMEVKEKIQNVKVEVNKEVRLNIRYNIVVNFADLVIENPYVESKLSLEMNPRSFGPSQVQESRLWISKNLNKYWRTNSNIATMDGIVYGDIVRQIPKYQAGVILSASTYFRNAGKSTRQSLYMIGVSKTF